MSAAESTPLQVAIAVVEHDGRYLIRRRPEGAPLAGYWEFPGGKVRSGETSPQAAERECLEETGLVVRAAELMAEVEHRYEHGALRLSFQRCRCETHQKSPEGGFQWVDGGRLNEYEFPPANARVLEIIEKRETGQQ
jgi:8-oxo-dGTP diphosphatase